jgi:hypothetical protein
LTTDDEVLTPGQEGHLISTEERMQQVREQMQSASPPPESTDGIYFGCMSVYIRVYFFVWLENVVGMNCGVAVLRMVFTIWYALSASESLFTLEKFTKSKIYR